MKKTLFLFLIVPFFALSQNTNSTDFFIQFNTAKFSEKVPLDSLFSHKAFASLNGKDSTTKMSDFISQMNQAKPMTIHGNLSDSIPYFQMTIPLVTGNTINQFMQKRLEKEISTSTDSVPNEMKKFTNYTLYSPKNESFSMAWNTDYLVIYSVLESLKKNKIQPFEITDEMTDSTYVEIDSAYTEVDELESQTVEQSNPVITSSTLETIENPTTDATSAEATLEEEEEEEEEDQQWEIEYKLEQEKIRQENLAIQEARIGYLFQNQFQIPSSAKTNPNADITAWVNYASIYESMTSFSRVFKSFIPSQNPNQIQSPILGMNMDFYFENNKARIEQAVEYAQPLAQIMQKVMARKPNKNIFNYFPKKEPLGYLSYHFSTQEMLSNYPQIMEQTLSNLPVDKSDIEVIADLISTIVDEKATASLMDGDFSVFLHEIQKYETTITETTYNDDYEEEETEKTVTKTRPIMSMVFTSTHPTMANKMIDLGIRKKLLVKENDYYVIQKSDDFGNLVMFKKDDVIIITNGLSYLNRGEKSDFSKQLKKELSSNNFSGNFEMQKFLNRFVNYDDYTTKKENYITTFNRFKNIHFTSSNKLKDNKNILQMEINSNYSDKNVILQTLDLLSLLN
jgi:hypothetical protein